MNKNVKTALLVGGLLLLVAVGVALFYPPTADEEAPIIVKNGSMIVTAGGGSIWTTQGNSWELTAAGGTHSGELYVKVEYNNGTPKCVGSGRPVHIDYDPGLDAIFNIAGNASSGYHTVLAPGASFQLGSTANILTHTGAGQITRVRIPSSGLNCDVPANSLVDIAICTADSISTCK